MITARHYYFLDEKGIAQASIRIADNPSGPNKISVFGAAKYLPIPLGEGCGQMVEYVQDRKGNLVSEKDFDRLEMWERITHDCPQIKPESSDKPIGWWS